jgi:branched-subunit amino acid transport protein
VTEVWITIAVLSASTVAIKAAGPLALGGRELPGRVSSVTRLVAPALLAALVVYETFSAEGGGLAVDARLAGLAGAGGALALRLPMLAAVVAAAGATAGARALGA